MDGFRGIKFGNLRYRQGQAVTENIFKIGEGFFPSNRPNVVYI